MNFREYQIHVTAVAIIGVSVYLGRLSVGDRNHEQECHAEIEAIHLSQRQIQKIEEEQSALLIKTSSDCIFREKQICEEKLNDQQSAEYDINCAICEQGGQL